MMAIEKSNQNGQTTEFFQLENQTGGAVLPKKQKDSDSEIYE